MDYYKILGVLVDDSQETIDRAYHDLLKKYDPSVNSSKTSFEKYRQVKKAYEKVKNQKEREIYNLETKIQESKKKKQEEIKEKNQLVNIDEYTLNEEKEKGYKVGHKILNKEEKNKYYLEKIENKKEKIKKEVSYLIFFFNSTIKVKVKNNIDFSSKNNCSLCLSKGKLVVNDAIVDCYNCLGKGYNYKKDYKKEFIKEYDLKFKKENKSQNFEFYEKKLDKIIQFHVFSKDYQNISFKDKEIKYDLFPSKLNYYNGFKLEININNKIFLITIPPFYKKNDTFYFKILDYSLIITVKEVLTFNNKLDKKIKRKIVKNNKLEVEEVNVESNFCLLGNTFKNQLFIGFRKNMAIKVNKKKKKLYILNEDKGNKQPVFKYFLPKVAVIIDFVIIGIIYYLLPYNITINIVFSFVLVFYVLAILYLKRMKV